jgi:AcrR family transcriptional regulator
MAGAERGRRNQRHRTRKELLQAAARLMNEGRKPTLEEVAQAALVSRATAYRYFPHVEPLLIEAALDLATPDAADLFADYVGTDPVARVERVDKVLHELTLTNNTQLRVMLMHSLDRSIKGDAKVPGPVRQNRRTPLLEAALAPAHTQFTPKCLDMLTKVLAVLVGVEAMVVFRDVLQVDEGEALDLKRWAIRALVEAAKKKAKARPRQPKR